MSSDKWQFEGIGLPKGTKAKLKFDCSLVKVGGFFKAREWPHTTIERGTVVEVLGDSSNITHSPSVEVLVGDKQAYGIPLWALELI